MTIYVFKLDDCDWWAGESLEACIEEAQKQCGKDCYCDPDDYSGPLSDEAMQKLRFVDEDGHSERSFAEELARQIASGAAFPQIFASTEF